MIDERHTMLETALNADPLLTDEDDFDGGETQELAPVDEKRIAIANELDEFDMVRHRIWRRLQGLIQRDSQPY